MFIRIKNIQKKRYAYLVKNTWSKRKKISKQKVIRYLGSIVTLEKASDKLFHEYHDIKDMQKFLKLFPSKTIFTKLLELELANLGFEKKGNKMAKDNISVSLTTRNVTKDSQPIVLEVNEGFISNYTLSKLYNFRSKTFNPKKEGLNFANTYLQAGMSMNNDVFIALFNKVYKKA